MDRTLRMVLMQALNDDCLWHPLVKDELSHLPRLLLHCVVIIFGMRGNLPTSFPCQ
jgi:hypothetical protein